jgi:hypothetical protein
MQHRVDAIAKIAIQGDPDRRADGRAALLHA